MNRPFSAKQKQGYWGSLKQDDKQQENKHQRQRRNVKLMRPDLTTNDFARILPRKMYKDKERLYSEGLQLKQAFNDVRQQNVRLKTQISMLQKEQEKVNRLSESQEKSKNNNNKSLLKSNKVQRSVKVVQDLKKMLRECRQQNLHMQSENNNIKKTIKYIKINELEIQLKVVIEQNKKLARLAEEYASQLHYDENLQSQNNDLRQALQKQYQDNKQLQEENERLLQVQEELQAKLKDQSEKWRAKQNKYLREANLQRRKQIQNQKHIQDLRRQMKSLLQNKSAQSNKLAARTANRPRHQKMLTQISMHRKDRESISDQDLAKSNQKLENELVTLKIQLEKAKKELQEERNRSNSKHFNYSDGFDQPQHKQAKERMNQFISYKQESDINIEAVYEQQFQNQENPSGKPDQKDSDKLIQHKMDYQEQSNEKPIIKKQQPNTKIKSTKSNKMKKIDSQKHSTEFKPNKQILSEIKQLLTYRMKSQRYPFVDLKNDIQSSDSPDFSYADLTNMLVNEPFYLKTDYVKVFLSYCYQKQQVDSKQTLSGKVMIQKLRKVIENFTLLSENQEKQMIIRIAEMTTAYPEELHIAFQNVKNGQETISKKDLIQMFKKLELQDKYIDLIISQLSLCSDDLQHLNFLGFFQRFYIGQEQVDDQAIQQLRQESQQSKINSSRVKKDIKKS